MLTPTKGIAPDRALLAIAAQILQDLDTPVTITQAWNRFGDRRDHLAHRSPVSFGWFVLALDVLYALGVIDCRDELLIPRSR